ncbi:MAG: hypothetical protein ACKVVP_09715, partial [Chloroflexota bacterium]
PLPLGEGGGEGRPAASDLPTSNPSETPPPQPSPRGRGGSWRPLLGCALWAFTAGAIYYALWPAMWAQPLATLFRALEFSARLGGTPHAPGNFLLGNTAEDPGPLFYPVALAFRLGPATSLGLMAMLAFGIPAQFRKVTWQLLLAAGLFLLLLTVSPKKVDRYLMPIVPWLTMVAAIGWWSALSWVSHRSWWPALPPRHASAMLIGSVLGLAVVQVWPLVSAGRYPLAAYNPLFGGARTAERAIPVGWGEGLDDAGAIIQSMSGGAPVTTSVWFPLRVNFQAHLAGPVVTERQINQADFFVDYIHARQRKHTPSQLQRQVPDAVVTIAGVEYARIYRLRRP